MVNKRSVTVAQQLHIGLTMSRTRRGHQVEEHESKFGRYPIRCCCSLAPASQSRLIDSQQQHSDSTCWHNRWHDQVGWQKQIATAHFNPHKQCCRLMVFLHTSHDSCSWNSPSTEPQVRPALPRCVRPWSCSVGTNAIWICVLSNRSPDTLL